MNLKEYIVNIPDFPSEGVIFRDISPILENPEVFNYVLDEFAKQIAPFKPTKIIAAEARGFLFGPAIALRLNIPFIPVRKKGKLPRKTIEKTYDLEYASATLQMHADALNKDDKVVVFDDVLATGGTAEAMIDMVNQLEAKVACCSFLIELLFFGAKEKLSCPTISLIEF